MKRRYTWPFVIIALLQAAGCGSLDRVRPQALQPSDSDLSSIQHNLVFFDVTIQQRRPTLKLRGIRARHAGTRELYNFPFVHNVLLKSSELPHVIHGNDVEHLVFLDLPEGVYSIFEVDFFNITRSSTISSLKQPLSKPLLFEVKRGGPSYLGRLNFRIGATATVESQENLAATMSRAGGISSGSGGLAVRPNSAMPGAALQTLSRRIETLSGSVAISVPDPRPADIEQARGRYPALANRNISSGRFWFGP